MEFVQKRMVWLGLGLMVIVGGGLKLVPVLTNHVHRTAGYEFLHQASEIVGDENTEPDFCVAGGIENPEALALVKQAVGVLEKGRNARPADAQTLLLLGRAYCLAGRLEEAVAAYEGYIQVRPGSPLGYLEGGFAYEEEGDFEKTLASWKAIQLSQSAFIENGKERMRLGNSLLAIEWFQKATLYFPETSDAYYELGLVYQSINEGTLALEAFSAALAYDTFNNVQVGDVYYQKGVVFQTMPALMDLEQAFAMYEMALETDSFSSAFIHANTYYKRGEIYLWQAQHLEEAISNFEEAIAIYPAHYLSHLRLGYALYQTSGNLPLAEKEILEAIDLWPNSTQKEWPYRVLSSIYEAEGLIDQAIAALQVALQLNPEDARAKLSLENLQAIEQAQP
jgi:tetratricopeptide (TPR) repeat protein